MRLTAQRDRGRLAWQIRRVQKRMAEIEARLTRAAHSETVSRSQPQEQTTNQRALGSGTGGAVWLLARAMSRMGDLRPA